MGTLNKKLILNIRANLYNFSLDIMKIIKNSFFEYRIGYS